MNITVSWTLSGGDSPNFYLININTNDPDPPYGGLLNITTPSVTQRELTGFQAGYGYTIRVRGVNCGSQEESESEPLTVTPQSMRIRSTLPTIADSFKKQKSMYKVLLSGTEFEAPM